ncbi:PH domain-containing protein [Oceanobacillus jeddahense]|uniref:PH domain-containing protein n=1 Tax=Oceanobacillus jeddahense TaxID=1462527 RepID=UPI0005963484|nr:PH domain-containing protein [Oceanobacillus jeddahense]
MKDIPAPQRRLSKDSIKVWLINEILSNAIGLCILGLLLYLGYYFSWKEWIAWIIMGLILFTIIDIGFSPFKLKRRYQHWRFGVSKEFLQLRSGALFQKHQVIPMTKIQSVSIHQGPLLRKYKLYQLKVNTITTRHTIPPLDEIEAMVLRQQIASYANVKERDA